MILYDSGNMDSERLKYKYPQLIRIREAENQLEASDVRRLTDKELGDIRIVVASLLARVQELTQNAWLKVDALPTRDLDSPHTEYHDMVLSLADLRRCVDDIFNILADSGDIAPDIQFIVDKSCYGTYNDSENLGWMTTFRFNQLVPEEGETGDGEEEIEDGESASDHGPDCGE